jgi:glucose/arabinose dehydrogenase
MLKSMVGVLACAGVFAAEAQVGDKLEAQSIISSGLSRPLAVVQPEGDARLFIVEQRSSTTGRIRVYKNGAMLTTPYLSISPVSTGNEQGLLGLAFHPDFRTNGWLYVNYTNAAGTTVIQRIRVADPNADVASIAEQQTILTQTQPFSNHNGGWLEFGPDGYLYIALGDGGSGGDPGNRAQNRASWLGKLLRLDVDGVDNVPGNADDDEFPADAGRLYAVPPSNPYVGNTAGYLPEIWAFGLRNPWRNSFDRETGELWIADVGQGEWEEVNRQPASSAGGENYGWNVREGLFPYSAPGPGFPPYVDPLFNYNHSNAATLPVQRLGCSVTGGFVYRGCAIPELRGYYLFGDLCQGWIGAYKPSDGSVEILPFTISALVSFGEDNDGELYVVSQASTARVYKLVPKNLTDCNANGKADACDIATGASLDLNNNAIPDECEPCIADIDGTPGLDLADFFYFFNCFDQSQACADLDGNPGVDLGDLFVFLNVFDQGCD